MRRYIVAKQLVNKKTIRMQIFRNYTVLIVSILLVILIVFGFTSFLSFYDRSVLEQSRELSLISNVLQNHMDNTIHNITSISVNPTVQEVMLRNASSDRAESITDRNLLNQTALKAFPTTQTLYCWEFVYSNGRTYGMNSYSSEEIDQLLVSSDFQSFLQKKRKASVVGLYQVKTNRFLQESEYMFLIVKPILELNTGKYCGAFLGFVPEKKLYDIYSENVPDNKTILFLLDSDQIICSSSDKSTIRGNLNDYFTTKNSVLGTLYIKDSTPYLMFTVPVSGYEWTLHSAVPLSTVLGDIVNLAILLVVVGVMGVCITLILAYVISQRITSPIAELTKTIQSIEQGNSTARAKVIDRTEVGVLCRVFNQLMDEQALLLQHTKEARDLNAEYRFQLFQAQIKPHFLYNSLEAIISLVQLNLKDDAIHSLHRLSEFYQLSLSNGNDIIPLAQEINLTADYLAIQKTRYVEFFDYEISVECDISKYTIPKLTLQPIVENSIYHGIKCKDCFGHIKLTVKDDGDCIRITVLDTGVGIPTEKLSTILNVDNQQHFGLANINERLKFFFTDFPGLHIYSVENSHTEVTIRIPKGDPHNDQGFNR